MLDNFHPLMQQANVDKTAAYYNDVFVPLGAVVPAMSQENVTKFNAYLDGIKGMQTDSAKLVPGGQHRLTFLHRHPHVPMAGAH